MNERIEMLKEMVEKSANPVGWIGYQEGHLVSFLKTQEQVNSFLTATDPTGRVEPVYTHPVEEQDESFDRTASHMAGEYVAYKAELTDEEIFKEMEFLPSSIAITNEDLVLFARAILRKASEK